MVDGYPAKQLAELLREVLRLADGAHIHYSFGPSVTTTVVRAVRSRMARRGRYCGEDDHAFACARLGNSRMTQRRGDQFDQPGEIGCRESCQ
jgi:hypothetical protein